MKENIVTELFSKQFDDLNFDIKNIKSLVENNPLQQLPTLPKKSNLKDLVPSTHSVSQLIQQRLENQDSENDGDEAFYVGDLGELVRQYIQWKKLLPRIEPFFGRILFLKSLNSSLVFFFCSS